MTGRGRALTCCLSPAGGRRPRGGGEAVDTGESRYVLDDTADPDVFIAEVDGVVHSPGGTSLDGTSTVSLVQIFRVRDGQIPLLRDYLSPASVG